MRKISLLFFILPIIVFIALLSVNFIQAKKIPDNIKYLPNNFITQAKIFINLENEINLEVSAASAQNNLQKVLLNKFFGQLKKNNTIIHFSADAGEFDMQTQTVEIFKNFFLDWKNNLKILGNHILIQKHTIRCNSQITIESDKYLLVAESAVFDIEDMSAKFYKPLLKIRSD